MPKPPTTLGEQVEALKSEVGALGSKGGKSEARIETLENKIATAIGIATFLGVSGVVISAFLYNATIKIADLYKEIAELPGILEPQKTKIISEISQIGSSSIEKIKSETASSVSAMKTAMQSETESRIQELRENFKWKISAKGTPFINECEYKIVLEGDLQIATGKLIKGDIIWPTLVASSSLRTTFLGGTILVYSNEKTKMIPVGIPNDPSPLVTVWERCQK